MTQDTRARGHDCPPARTLSWTSVSAVSRPRNRMQLAGRGHRLPQGWHSRRQPDRFSETRRALQLMRGR